jgi:hypothetical protein
LDNERFKAEGLARRAWLRNPFKGERLSFLIPGRVPWAMLAVRLQRAEDTASDYGTLNFGYF